MKKQITLDGKPRTIEANALLPRQYRKEFGRDIVVDMNKLCAAAKKGRYNIDFEILENVTWLMLRAAGEDVPDTVDAWLSSLDEMFAVYGVQADVIELWRISQNTTSKSKKK